jgi:hypothetical protein
LQDARRLRQYPRLFDQQKNTYLAGDAANRWPAPFNRSHQAVVRAYDEAGKIIEAHEQGAISNNGEQHAYENKSRQIAGASSGKPYLASGTAKSLTRAIARFDRQWEGGV